jgi:hypothetical protein
MLLKIRLSLQGTLGLNPAGLILLISELGLIKVLQAWSGKLKC